MKKPGLIQRFFILCAGPSRAIIYQCPTEWNKYTGIGATIFFTGLLACLSGGYALYSIFRGANNDLFFALAFGLIWGLLIFNLDRFVVLSIKKEGNIRKELISSVPRIILAILISIVISKPLEIKIFESRIAQQILEDKMSKLAADKELIDKLNDLSLLDSSIKDRNYELIELDSLRGGDPINATFKRLISEKNTALSELNRIAQVNGNAISNYNSRINSIRNDAGNYRSISDDSGRIARKVLLDRARRQIDGLITSRNALRQEIDDANKKVRDLNSEIQEQRVDHQTSIAKQIDERRSQLDQTLRSKKRADSIADLQRIESAKIKEESYTNNFITQLEALGNLTSGSTSMRLTSWMIMLLFMIVEISPIIVKVLSAKGPYDEMLNREENAIALEEARKTKELQANIDALMEGSLKAAEISGRVFVSLKEEELNAQVVQNKEILEKVASRQAQLIDIYIDSWFEEERAKILGINNVPLSQKAVLEEVFWRQETPPVGLEYFFRNGKAQNNDLICIDAKNISKGIWSYGSGGKEINIELMGNFLRYEILELHADRLVLKEQGQSKRFEFIRIS